MFPGSYCKDRLRRHFSLRSRRPEGLIAAPLDSLPSHLTVLLVSHRRLHQDRAAEPQQRGFVGEQSGESHATLDLLVDQRYLIMDRDTKFRESFHEFLISEEVVSVRLPPRSPNLNSHLERFMRSRQIVRHLIPQGNCETTLQWISQVCQQLGHNRWHSNARLKALGLLTLKCDLGGPNLLQFDKPPRAAMHVGGVRSVPGNGQAYPISSAMLQHK